MGHEVSLFKKIIFFNLTSLIFLPFLILNVSALDINGYGYASPSQGGGSGNCLSQWGGCTPGFAANIAFRLTLVDSNGHKIPGTKSVDFSSSEFYHCPKNEYGFPCAFGSPERPVYNLISSITENGKYIARYGYKYSVRKDENGNIVEDYNIATPSDPFIMYYDTKGYFKNQYTVEQFLKNETNLTVTYYATYNDKNMAFIDIFLHYCGFFKDDEERYKKLDESDDRYYQLKDSFIIVEPAYPVYYYSSQTGGTVYMYGTVTELARTMINNPGFGIDYGLSNALRKNVVLCVSENDKTDYLKNFYAIQSGTNNCSNNSYGTSVSLQDLVNNDKAYGVSVASIFDHPKETDNKYTINACDQTIYKTGDETIKKSGKTGNKISLLANKRDLTKNMISWLKSDDFKVSGSDENQSLYCFDSVEYHLDDILNDLSGNYNKFIFVNPRPGKVTVSRYCLVGNNYNSNEQYDISSYENNAIKVNFYGKTYYIYPSDSETNTNFNVDSKTNVVKPMNFTKTNVSFIENKTNDVDIEGNKYKYVSYSFELNYIVPQNLLFVGNGNLDENGGYVDGKVYNAYVSLSNFAGSFGYSNKMINNKLTAEIKNTFDTTTCPFTYKIKDDSESKSNISFRVISLNNPFPARDGSSRMPSENWLYDENNVFNYITTNRGVLGEWKEAGVNKEGFPTYELVRNPELIYSQREPMYSITLTPSTMLSIRSYNKKYSYYSMYELGDYKSKDDINSDDKNADKLKCNDQGRECYSEFLRDSRYIPQNDQTISGDCFMSGGESKNVRDEFNSYYGANQVFTKSDVQRYYDDLFEGNINNKYGVAYGADLNYNGRMDSEDIEIMTEYAKANQFENKDDYDQYVESTDDFSILDTQIYREKYIKYYTCANKSYKSGGPVEEEK